MQAKEYRPDIDVLRAIAVLSVIFYHSRIPFFSGGFVGVSIFFVISGYLITGIIKRKLENGTFSFVEFYENRVRRIFPALFVMGFCLVLFEWITSVNIFERRELYSSAKRTLLTIPNIYFYLHTNYFDPAAETMPLLHTWSLGVEEQFYFIFPLLLFTLSLYLYKTKRLKITPVLWTLFALSFVFAAIFVLYNQKFTFYMLPTRAWELLCGALLTYTNWTPATQKGKSLCILAGLGLMFGSVIFYDNVLFPGFWALPPCLGAVLYIAGGTGYTFSNRKNLIHVLTNNKVLVFIGVISYSLYLWHWPVLVYYQNWLYRRDIELKSGIILLAVIFLVSAFSWRFIERPVRRNALFKKHGVLWASVLCCFCLLFLFIDHLKFTLSLDDGFAFTYRELPAEYTVENSAEHIVLIGDSHAMHLKPIMQTLGDKYHISSLSCHILPYHTYITYGGVENKQEIKNSYAGFEETIHHFQAKTAVIAYRYDYYINGMDIVRKNANRFQFKSLDYASSDPYEVLYVSLKETLEVLQKNGVETVYFVAPMPQATAFVPLSANKLSGIFHFSTEKINAIIGEPAAVYQERTQKIRGILEKLTQEFSHVYFLDPAPYFLNSTKTGYDVVAGNTAYYIDDDHLSQEGAALLIPLFEPVFANAVK